MSRTRKELTGPALVLGYVGLFLILIGLLELVPMLNLIFYPDEVKDGLCFLYPAIGAIGLGSAMFFPILKRPKGKLSENQGLSMVLLVWILAITFFSIPWMISGKMDFTRAFFECTSGFTTTGMTTCDVDNTSHVFIFSRSLMTFTGGIGLVLILTTAISDKSRTGLYTLEGHTDQLLPNLRKSARTILLIYLGFSLLGVLGLKISGLTWFEAINITMSSISTGGFATNSLSMSYFNNIWAEIIVIILMAVGATNFLFHFFVIKGDFKKAFKNYEFITGVLLFVILGGLLVLGFTIQEGSFGLGLRYGIFQYFTSMTGGGFTNTTTPMMNLSPMLLTLVIITMACGGQSGSTAGGIKHFRISYIFVSLKETIHRKSISHDMVSISSVNKWGERVVVKGDDKKDAVNYAFLYMLVAALGGFLIACCKDPLTGKNYGALESFFEFLSCLGTTGLSSGVTSANTAKFALWVESFGMFFGRLELTILFVYIERNLIAAKHHIFSSRKAKID